MDELGSVQARAPGGPSDAHPPGGPDRTASSGHAVVDEVLGSLERLSELSVAEHVTVFESAHDRLRAALADVDASTSTTTATTTA